MLPHRARDRPPPEREASRTPSGDEPGSVVAKAREPPRCARAPGSRLRLVHRGLRPQGLARGETPLNGVVVTRCSQCGFENRVGVRFCEHCGAKPPELICPACGAAVPPDRRFCWSCGKPLAPSTERASVVGPSAVTPNRTAPEAERRQLTVMFCDLVGSTALSERLDPEDLRDVLRAYQDTCAEALRRFEGHIAQTLGDGLMVYFGYPRADEDDVHRAVRAGLEILHGIAGLDRRLRAERGVAVAVRIGIHTGLVVAGEVGGADTRADMAVIGETPNVAARLQALATPNTVVVSEATWRLLGGAVEAEELGGDSLKGPSPPQRLFPILKEHPPEGRDSPFRPGRPFREGPP